MSHATLTAASVVVQTVVLAVLGGAIAEGANRAAEQERTTRRLIGAVFVALSLQRLNGIRIAGLVRMEPWSATLLRIVVVVLGLAVLWTMDRRRRETEA